MANQFTALPAQELTTRPGLATMADANANSHLRIRNDFIVRELASLAAQRILEAPVRVREGSERTGRWRLGAADRGRDAAFAEWEEITRTGSLRRLPDRSWRRMTRGSVSVLRCRSFAHRFSVKRKGSRSLRERKSSFVVGSPNRIG